MANDENKSESFLGGLIKARVEGLKDAAKQGLDDVTKTISSGAKTVDGVIRDKNTSYLEIDSDPDTFLYQVMTKGEGKNARVTLWPDRLEWEKDRGISGGKVLAAVMTSGLSLAFTGVRGKKDAFDVLPLSAVVSVSIRNGKGGQIVAINTAGGDIDFCVSRQNAAEFRMAILNQLQVRANTPMKVVVDGAKATATSDPDFTDQLKKLGELRDAGILTEEEFQAKKADILAKM